MGRQETRLRFPHVSIPMTVLGGLQSRTFLHLLRRPGCFNTDDGIRRAAMC